VTHLRRPTLESAAVVAELSAVDAENERNKSTDGRRQRAVLRAEAVRQEGNRHPFSLFGTGSAESLLRDGPGGLQAALRDFHRTYYHLRDATVVLVGPQSLADLESLWTDAITSSTPIPLPTAEEEGANVLFPVESARWRPDSRIFRSPGTVLGYSPLKPLRSLEVFFQGPPVTAHWRQKPWDLISHCVGHEGAGSILAALRARGLASGLSAGCWFSCETSSIFSVSVSLTPAADETPGALREVLLTVYAYLSLLASGGIPRATRADYQAETRLRFDRQPGMSATHLAQVLAHGIADYDVESALSGAYLLDEEADDALLSSFLAQLTPDNSVLMVSSSSLDPLLGQLVDRQTEAVAADADYGFAYRRADVRPDLLADLRAARDGDAPPAIRAALHPPAPNDYLPRRLDFKGTPLPLSSPARAPLIPPTPRQLAPASAHPLYHVLDTGFDDPLVHLRILLRSRTVYATPRSAVLTSLLCLLLDDALVEVAYQAELAGLAYNVGYTHEGLTLDFSGYDDRMPSLVRTVLGRLRDPVVVRDAAAFARVHDGLVRRLASYATAASHAVAKSGADSALTDLLFTAPVKLAATLDVEGVGEVERFLHEQLLHSQWTPLMLVHGNATEAEARAYADLVASSWPLSDPTAPSATPVPCQVRRGVMLTPGERVIRRQRHPNATDTNSTVELLFQVGRDLTPSQMAPLAVLARHADKFFFQQLRTVRQLGYIVWAGHRVIARVAYFRVLVVSTVAGCARLEREVTECVAEQRRALAALTPDEFAHLTASQADALSTPDVKMSHQTSRVWAELTRDTHQYDRRAKTLDALRALRLEDVLALADRCVVDGSRAASFSSRVYGCNDAWLADESRANDELASLAGVRLVHIGDDVGVSDDAFRQARPLFPGASDAKL
jgi:insulysin